MVMLPTSMVRPARLNDVKSPAVLLSVGKYGASFLIIGSAAEEMAVFLDGDYAFQFFPKAKADHWEGLAIEGVEFELDTDAAVDLDEVHRAPGMMVRRANTLSMAAAPDGRFARGSIELPVQTDLPTATEGKAIAFTQWRAFVKVDDEQRTVWENGVPRQSG